MNTWICRIYTIPQKSSFGITFFLSKSEIFYIRKKTKPPKVENIISFAIFLMFFIFRYSQPFIQQLMSLTTCHGSGWVVENTQHHSTIGKDPKVLCSQSPVLFPLHSSFTFSNKRDPNEGFEFRLESNVWVKV